MYFIPQGEVKWKTVKYLQEPLGGSPTDSIWKYTLTLPVPLADWDVWDYWEKERIASMEQHLKDGEILFDVGTEHGWCNLVYAKLVGPENMVLIEPTQEFWPNIRTTWFKNFDVEPMGFYDGLFSDKTTDERTLYPKEWPNSSYGDLIDRNKYQYIHDNGAGIPEITLDEYVKRSGIVPDAITMDTEGSEMLILKGSEKTLKKHHPKLFISIHDDLGLRDYGTKPDEVVQWLAKLGYQGEYLGYDHEAHWYFQEFK